MDINVYVYIILALIVSIIALILTVKQLGRSDANYDEETKPQVKRLTMIYLIAIFGSIIALVIYMSVT
ncbi:hypothetical protein JCM21714_3386 [Gracilibacillus boraciitolerans JCM 21714]|uniref:Uncharacterized protein n=1 Tax=Gracilibacillus boraciitolerans JCM 21714 TaxID=1298598 RepID=W4VM44_9BACI|nr:hypothetical protein [Gracilibacillus boraciitolerans]GAE94246.1 hypothetical protein JCM21714_3386 [Gracilibacillus boraciitolerans JCM 21714]